MLEGCSMRSSFLVFAGDLLYSTLATHVAYPSAAYLAGRTCSGVVFFEAGGQGIFLPGHMGGCLVLGLIVTSLFSLIEHFVGCVSFWQKSGKFQNDVSS